MNLTIKPKLSKILYSFGLYFFLLISAILSYVNPEYIKDLGSLGIFLLIGIMGLMVFLPILFYFLFIYQSIGISDGYLVYKHFVYIDRIEISSIKTIKIYKAYYQFYMTFESENGEVINLRHTLYDQSDIDKLIEGLKESNGNINFE